jgi:hypothetical protein
MLILQSGQVHDVLAPSQCPVFHLGQRSSSETPRSALSMCQPHPAQVALPHVLQVSWLIGRLVVKEDRGFHRENTNKYKGMLGVNEMTAAERVKILRYHLTFPAHSYKINQK